MNKQLILGFDEEYQSTINTGPNDPDPLQGESIDRPIHYLGSKLRIINAICKVVDNVDPSSGPVCDVFAGSGTVSKALANTRDVISIDIQEYSRVLCSALLQPPMFDEEILQRFWRNVRSSEHSESLPWAVKPLVDYEADCQRVALNRDLEPLCDLLEYGSLIAFENNACNTKYQSLRDALGEVSSRLRKLGLIDSPSALTIRYFGGIYFSFLQASQLDILLEAIASVPPTHKDSFLATILSTASEIVNTVGKQFAQPIRPRLSDGKPKPNVFQLVARDRFADVVKVYESWLNRYLGIPRTNRNHQIICKDYAEALDNLQGEVNVIYADPPYTRDHYSRFYHVLETFCLRDNPSVATVRLNGGVYMSRGIYRTERHQSPFCIKTKAPAAFSTLFSKSRRFDAPLILSYSPYEKDTGARPRLMTISEIEELARKFYRRVEAISAGKIAHNKLNNSEKNTGMSYDAEVLLICEP